VGRVRYPAVSGTFYEGNREALIRRIEWCFKSPPGPGRLPSETPQGRRRNIRGLVVPHAGYMYSGPIAAHAYLSLWEDGLPSVFVIIGPNHYGTSSLVSTSDEDFMTPLGTAKIDRQLISEIRGGLIEIDDEAQLNEHSIEVQLPFLQYMSPDVLFVPLCMGAQDLESTREVGMKLKRALKGRDAVIIASSDFSHYVPAEEAERKDRKAIDAILSGDASKLYDVVVKEDISMCGYGAVMAMLSAVNFSSAKMLAYGNSGMMKKMKDVVGYSSIMVE